MVEKVNNSTMVCSVPLLMDTTLTSKNITFIIIKWKHLLDVFTLCSKALVSQNPLTDQAYLLHGYIQQDYGLVTTKHSEILPWIQCWQVTWILYSGVTFSVLLLLFLLLGTARRCCELTVRTPWTQCHICSCCLCSHVPSLVWWGVAYICNYIRQCTSDWVEVMGKN